MEPGNEILKGILAAIISVIILGGSLVLALEEDSASLAYVASWTPSPAHSSTPVNTTRPGEPTHTPSLTPEPTNTPTESRSTSCPYPEGWIQITVQEGDNLESLAQAYEITAKRLSDANCLLSDSLPVGASIYVPPPSPTLTSSPVPPPPTQPIQCGPPPGWIPYTVQPGDNLYRISLAYGVSISQLQQANCLGSSTRIKTGQLLYVPNVPTRVVTATPSRTPTKTATPTASKTNPPTSTKTPQPPTSTQTNTLTATATNTATSVPTATNTSTPTPVPPTATSTQTPSPTATATNTTD